MNNLSFRLLTEKDIDGLFDLLNSLSEEAKNFFHPHSFDRKTLKQICTSKEDHYFVLTLNDTIIGYSFLRHKGYITPSFGICIRNGYERKGYGKIMLQKTIEQTRQRGISEVILHVHQKNARAITLYRNAGFIPISQDDKTGEIKMKKSLP
jgi:ribosomal-protein-alanine N-acetyltransferase